MKQVEGPTFEPGDEWRLKEFPWWHGVILRRREDVNTHDPTRGKDGIVSQYEVMSYNDREELVVGPWFLLEPEVSCLKKVTRSEEGT